MKVMVVEDEENNIVLLVRRLERKDHEVICAVNGKEAIELLKTNLPDIILMDMRMPIMDGYEATKSIKNTEAYKHIPIIGISAHASEVDIKRALEAGCDKYITKPINFKSLYSIFENYSNLIKSSKERAS